MNKALSVERLPDTWMLDEYDIAIGTVGYESRSRHTFERFNVRSKIKAAACFQVQQVLAFDENVSWYRENGFSLEPVSDSDYEQWLLKQIPSKPEVGNEIHILIDISSLSRIRLAKFISVLRGFKHSLPTVIDFVYCLALFTPPPIFQSPNTHVGPVTDEFAGWWTEPDRKLSVIVGLGYEPDKALGAVEYLEAQDVWVFQPKSVIDDYTPALESANQALLNMADQAHRFVYRVQDPLECFSRMQSLVQGLVVNSNVVILPFGPKIIVLTSLLVASSDKRVAVWRVGAQNSEEPVDRHGSENFYGLRVRVA